VSGFDPRGKVNRALIVGVSEYDHTRADGDEDGVAGHLEAVRHNRKGLGDVLRHGGVFGRVSVCGSPSQDEFSEALHRETRDTEGLLLFYFAGHAIVSLSGDELFLQARNARMVRGKGDAFSGAVRFSDVLAELAASRAERVMVILDCCYAGNAAGIWHRLDDHRRRREISLLMSVQSNQLIGPGDHSGPTPFTHELIQVLGEGGELWLSAVYEALKSRMRAAGVPTLSKDIQAPQAEWEQGEDVLLGAAELAVPAPPPRTAPHQGPLRRGARLALTLALALAATATGAGAVVVLANGDETCAPPLHLRLLTDPDLEPALTAAANAYTASDANSPHGCRRSGIGVYSARAADVVTTLRSRTDQWQRPYGNNDPQRDVGPQPDIWIPATRADVYRVQSEREDRAFAQLDLYGDTLAYSPLVLAVPGSADGPRTGRPLARVVDDVEAGGTGVRRPDPDFTDAALLATAGLYADSPDVRGVERKIAYPGQPARTAAELLCGDGENAVLVPEFALKGKCPDGGWTSRDALYPDDVSGIAPAFVKVTWEDGDRDAAARADEVERFRRWLTGADGRAVLGEYGFRSPDGTGRLLGETAPGVLPDPGGSARYAEASAMSTALDRYRNSRGPGQVLFLLDSSGSMDNLWQGPSGGPGLLQQSLGGLDEKDDRYGVWAVAGTAPGRTHAELLPFAPHKRADAERALDAAQRAGVQDAEADPYRALWDALEFMKRQVVDSQRPRLIVYLTDDEDNNRLSGRHLDELLGPAREAGVPVTMVSLATSGCEAGRADAVISLASEGRCLDPGDDLGAALRDEVARTGTGEKG